MFTLLHANDLHWQWHPDVVLACAVMLGAYVYSVTSLRHDISDAVKVRWSQSAAFALGVAAIFVVSVWPIHEISEERLASVHMFQHLVYTMVAPPLLLWGLPAWLVRAPLRNATVLRSARVVTHPLVAFAAFNAVQLVTHFPSSVNLALDVHGFHLFVHVLLVGTAMMMWWPILSPVEELPRLSYPLQMGYLFIQSLIPAVLAAFLTFSSGVLYDAYADAPRMWGLSPIEDQQYAAFVMKILGSLILWSFIAYAFFKWYERESQSDRGPRWEEVRDEMERMGLPIDTPAPRGSRLN